MNNSSFSNHSLVERAFEYLYDNRGDLVKPVAMAIGSEEKLESCDAVQKVFSGTSSDAHVISNYVTIDASNGTINRWQFIVFSPSKRCDNAEECPKDFPLCSSIGSCSRLFEGSKDGLKNALSHVLAQVEQKSGLSAALVKTFKNPLEKNNYRCEEILFSTREFENDLTKENIFPKKAGQKSTCKSCGQKPKDLKFSQQKKKQDQHRMILGVSVLILILAMVAIIVATKKSYAAQEKEQFQNKLDALYQDMVYRKAYDEGAASASTDSSIRY